MLTDLQTYIAKNSIVSMADLSLHFCSDSEAIRPMLTKLCRKGRIRKLPIPEKCGDCTCCEMVNLECYEWVGSEGEDH
jgi:hypothetical protein